MVHIKVKRGLDIPIAGKPEGSVKRIVPAGVAHAIATPDLISLNLKPFSDLKLRLLVKPDDVVALGQPLLEDKACPQRKLASPAAGRVKEVRRGLKRSLVDLVIEVEKNNEENLWNTESFTAGASRDALCAFLSERGAFAHLRQRPFNTLADPTVTPRTIFVKALESAPFTPAAELQVDGNEKEFQLGLNALATLSDGNVHLVYRKGSSCKAFIEAKNVTTHTVEGPHPAANHSLHIEKIDPITKADDIVWTATAHDVVVIGHLISSGRYFVNRVIAIAGTSILEDRRGYFKVRTGFPITALMAGRIERSQPQRLISGDPLMGDSVAADDFLGFNHFAFCALPESEDREFLHFFRLGAHKYSFSGAYLSGHLDNSHREYEFTTSAHGEHRPFIDGSLYDKVMPLQIPTMTLVKAIMAEDYDLAANLGLLSVDSEDFALPTFVCPSKMEMTHIVKQGLKAYAADILA